MFASKRAFETSYGSSLSDSSYERAEKRRWEIESSKFGARERFGLRLRGLRALSCFCRARFTSVVIILVRFSVVVLMAIEIVV